MQLENKVAVLVGGGAGIGRTLALQLAEQGARVVVGDRDKDRASGVAAEVVAAGGTATALACNLGDDASMADFAKAAHSSFGQVDLLFNHAGASLGGIPEEISSDDWNQLLNINITGLGRSLRNFLPLMANPGWIVNTSSGLGLFHDLPVAGPYLMTKAAIIAYSRSLTVLLRNRGIGVSVFCPDLTLTDFAKVGVRRGLVQGWPPPPMPVERAQSAELSAEIALAGLKAEKFLISATPNTQEKMRAMVEGMYEPGSDMIEEDGKGRTVLQTIAFRAEASIRDAVITAVHDYAAETRAHFGCRRATAARDLRDDAKFEIAQLWEDRTALDSHMLAPATLAFQQSMIDLGVLDIEVSRC